MSGEMAQPESAEATDVTENPPAIREDPLRNQTVRVVTDAAGCRQVIAQLREHCSDYPVLGFDCEWVKGSDNKKNRVALLELATHRGLCALIRMNKLVEIPDELGDLLNDPAVLKVGIDPFEDANLLVGDYNLSVRSTLDLRHLACKCGHPELDGLKKLSEALLGVTLNKNWKLRASNWESDELDPVQVQYAANDAHVAVELFRTLAQKLEQGSSTSVMDTVKKFEGCFDQKYRRPKMKNKSSKK